MRVAFRTDANATIGTGHFMRCLTLAGQLNKVGAEVDFICHNLPTYLGEMLIERGINLTSLTGTFPVSRTGDLAHSHWLWTDQAYDAKACMKAMGETLWDWVIVDHYALDHRWETDMRKAAKGIMAIDDLADRRHDCDILLDQNYYLDMNDRYRGKVPEKCNMLLGPSYALLREEFRILRKQIKPRNGKVCRILVFFGGVDAENYTGLAVQALADLDVKDIAVDVIIGAGHPERLEIENTCTAKGYACYVQTPRMAELMAEADLAIGAGGSATWERCSMGLPSMSVCIAENQQKQLMDAASAALLYSPFPFHGSKDDMQLHVRALINNPALRSLLSSSAMQTVDGRGAVRVARILTRAEIEIRLAEENDSRNLFEWRNHPRIRSSSRSQKPISWEEHQEWFDGTLLNRDKLVLIASIHGKALGVVRFDVNDLEAEVSIYMVPESGFSGYGLSMLLSAEQWLEQHYPSILRLRALVLEGNDVSHQMFRSAGYLTESSNYSKELKSKR